MASFYHSDRQNSILFHIIAHGCSIRPHTLAQLTGGITYIPWSSTGAHIGIVYRELYRCVRTFHPVPYPQQPHRREQHRCALANRQRHRTSLGSLAMRADTP
jgi:hypothetical protein